MAQRQRGEGRREGAGLGGAQPGRPGILGILGGADQSVGPLEEVEQKWEESLGEERGEDCTEGRKLGGWQEHFHLSPTCLLNLPIPSKLPKVAQGSPASGPLLMPFPTRSVLPNPSQGSFEASSQVTPLPSSLILPG